VEELTQKRDPSQSTTIDAARTFWTNPSVTALAQGDDPILVIIQKTRELVFRALEDGWQGPPFDPFWLAGYRKISVTPLDGIPDARLVPGASGGGRIEFNPNQPRARVRFSLAHEIAHTLFPDYDTTIRNRLGQAVRNDDWQLELLCNIAAAEILIPPIPALNLGNTELSIQNLIPLWKKFDVSPEAFLLRIIRLTNTPASIFAAARVADDSNPGFRLDYCIPSSSSNVRLRSGLIIPNSSVLSQCSAIGFTARGPESWQQHGDPLDTDCIGVPPYPGKVFPRVIGILRPTHAKQVKLVDIEQVYGTITEPRGEGRRIIAHIVNHRSSTFGAGVALSIATRWPSVQEDFRKWATTDRDGFKLGNIRESFINNELSVVSMVAQHGYGDSRKPRIRYSALSQCLFKLALIAKNNDASVHMPKIGTGFAGGSWDIIEELVRETLVGQGVSVLVYLLPRFQKTSPQSSIHSFAPDMQT